MGVIKLNGKEYGGGGGGGNANIVELTQAEYDALPESKLTDGILYCITDGDGDVINFVNGVYVNPDNLIVSETNFTSSLSYTATQDCIVCMYLVCLENASTYIKINNKVVQNYWQSQMVTTASAPIYVKKGQTLTVSGAHRDYDSSYWVYGVQTGSVSNAQHNYSTSEQVIGTWINGKPLYEKTFTTTLDNVPSATPVNMADVSGLRIDEIANVSGRVNYYNGTDLFNVNLGTYFGTYIYPNGYLQFFQTITAQTTNRSYKVSVTLQYTKTTD